MLAFISAKKISSPSTMSLMLTKTTSILGTLTFFFNSKPLVTALAMLCSRRNCASERKLQQHYTKCDWDVLLDRFVLVCCGYFTWWKHPFSRVQSVRKITIIPWSLFQTLPGPPRSLWGMATNSSMISKTHLRGFLSRWQPPGGLGPWSDAPRTRPTRPTSPWTSPPSTCSSTAWCSPWSSQVSLDLDFQTQPSQVWGNQRM